VINNEIKLTNKETQIFSLLLDVIKAKTPDTTIRVAGGLIRDRLLNKISNDIDITIDNMTGEKFATLVNEYMIEKGLNTKSISVIKANPDQSKHLETATIKIFGLPIDFVNLRTENYSDSRIPTTQIGSPIEDAQRRDLTINSLFYNINTNQIEDFVGGLQDLNDKIARTPLDPIQTFLDDPLRILRTIRFAARYNLTIDPSIITAANLPEVKYAFENKISKERIWAELAGKKEKDQWKDGALSGDNPVIALQLLKDLGLIDLIFKTKTENMVPWDTEQNNPHHEFTIWKHTFNVFENTVNQSNDLIRQDKETYLVRNLAALLHDIGKRSKDVQQLKKENHTSYHGHEKLSSQIAEEILTNLHSPIHITKRIVKLIDMHLSPHVLKTNGSPKSYRKYVRDFPDWNHSIDLAIADNLGKKTWTNNEDIKSEINEYENLRNHINKSIPDGVINILRPISGNDLIQLGIKPGPIMGIIMKEIDDALLSNPKLTKKEAIEITKYLI
jgi:tRNA nucleotidyltransferase/poly(A) polymerase